MPHSLARPASPGLTATTRRTTRRASGTGGAPAVVAQAGGLPESALQPAASAAHSLHPAAAARRAAAEARCVFCFVFAGLC